jgi:hypothetical protein
VRGTDEPRRVRRLKEESEGTRSKRGRDISPRAISPEAVAGRSSWRSDMRIGFLALVTGKGEEVWGIDERRGMRFAVPFSRRVDFMGVLAGTVTPGAFAVVRGLGFADFVVTALTAAGFGDERSGGVDIIGNFADVDEVVAMTVAVGFGFDLLVRGCSTLVVVSFR